MVAESITLEYNLANLTYRLDQVQRTLKVRCTFWLSSYKKRC
jgi:hypothetical protein